MSVGLLEQNLRKLLKTASFQKDPRASLKCFFLVISEKFQSTVAMVIVVAIIILIKLINTTN